MALKISFTTLACPDWDLDTIIARAVEYGYDAVDFRMLQGQMAIYELPEFSSRIEQTKGKLSDAGLVVSGISSSARMFASSADKRAEHLEIVRRQAEVCDALGVGYIRVFGGKMEGTGLDEAISISLDTLSEMSAAAGSVNIAVETHDDWVHTSRLAKLFDKVSADNVFILWDLHHPFRLAGESPRQTYDNIGRFTRYTHLKDSKATSDGSFVSMLPGEGGDVPLDKMVELLIAGGYEGYLTLEWEKHWHRDIAAPEVALPAYVPFMRKLAERGA